jgi:hypothetical protein
MAEVKITHNDEIIDLGNLRRVESRFMFLPRDGAAVVSVTFEDGQFTQTACQAEIDETKQHLEVSLHDKREAVCTVTDALFSEVLVTKFF